MDLREVCAVGNSPNLPADFFEPARRFFRVLPRIKSRDTKVTFTLHTETDSGRDDDLDTPQHLVENLPTAVTGWRRHPDIGRVSSTEDLQAGRAHRFCKYLRVA